MATPAAGSPLLMRSLPRGLARPPATPPGSGTLKGAGDPKPKRGCPKGKRAVRKGGKTRCVKKHGKKQQQKRQQRTTNDKRRTHR